MNKKLTIDYDEYQKLVSEHKAVCNVLNETSLVLRVAHGRFGHPDIYIIKDNQSAFRDISDAYEKDKKEIKEYYEKLLSDKKEKKGFWRRLFK